VTEQKSTVKTVMRGYDPAEGDRRLEEIAAEVTTLTQQRDGLASRVEELHEASSSDAEPPSFEHLGERVGQILSLADKEASELRERAQAEAEAHRNNVHADAASVRDEADHYASKVRSEAEGESLRIIEAARKAADEHRDSAERDASVRLQEAEAIYEEQRARAAKAAADFETTLAGRRKAAEDEFTQKMAESQSQLYDASRLAERTRTDAEHARMEANLQVSRLLEEARQEAARIVGDAKATAERVRTDSERELAAASQRRDSINAQLTNVRQMLATLTGTAAMPLAAFGADEEDDDVAEGDVVEEPGVDDPTDLADPDADPSADEADEIDDAARVDEGDEGNAEHGESHEEPVTQG